MDGIEIKITGNTPMETLASLAAFGMHCLANKDICEAAERIYKLDAAREAEKQRQDTAPKPAPDAPAPVPTAPVAPAAPAPLAPAPLAPAPLAPAPTAPFAMPPAPLAPTPAAQAPAPVPPPVSTAAPGYTLYDITRAGADFITAHPKQQEALKRLLLQFGVQSLAELRPEQIGPFVADMRSMGVKI